MKLYLNNDNTGIEITQFNHNFQFSPTRTENYNITLGQLESIEEIATKFGTSQITTITIEKDNTIIRTINTNVHIDNLDEMITELTNSITMHLSQTLDNQ